MEIDCKRASVFSELRTGKETGADFGIWLVCDELLKVFSGEYLWDSSIVKRGGEKVGFLFVF